MNRCRAGSSWAWMGRQQAVCPLCWVDSAAVLASFAQRPPDVLEGHGHRLEGQGGHVLQLLRLHIQRRGRGHLLETALAQGAIGWPGRGLGAAVGALLAALALCGAGGQRGKDLGWRQGLAICKLGHPPWLMQTWKPPVANTDNPAPPAPPSAQLCPPARAASTASASSPVRERTCTAVMTTEIG